MPPRSLLFLCSILWSVKTALSEALERVITMKKYVCGIICAMFLVGTVFGCAIAANAETAGSVRITIRAPSDPENVIAPRRHFKVSGELNGTIPDDAIMRVRILDKESNEVRYAETGKKGTGQVCPNAYTGAFTVFSDENTFEEIAYTAPEFVVRDVNSPELSFHDATIKCIYTNECFYALIVSATDIAHGLAEDDQFRFTDQNGQPYDALTEGAYSVHVSLTSSDGILLGTAAKAFEIGKTEGTVIHEITSSNAIAKGGMNLLTDWAAKEHFTVLTDMLPGFFGEHYQMSAMPMSVGAETAEYLPGRIEVLLYNNTETSTSYCLEIAKYLMLEETTEKPEIVNYYTFDLGEPSVGGVSAKIIGLDDEKIHICRVDQVDADAQSGIFVTTEEQIITSDICAEDGWSVKKDGKFAVAGVVQPFQLDQDELEKHPDIYGYSIYKNGPKQLMYTFVSENDPNEIITLTGNVGVERRNDVKQAAESVSIYEYYNVFDAAQLREDTAYDVSVRLVDREGREIEGWTQAFTLIVID